MFCPAFQFPGLSQIFFFFWRNELYYLKYENFQDKDIFILYLLLKAYFNKLLRFTSSKKKNLSPCPLTSEQLGGRWLHLHFGQGASSLQDTFKSYSLECVHQDNLICKGCTSPQLICSFLTFSYAFNRLQREGRLYSSSFQKLRCLLPVTGVLSLPREINCPEARSTVLCLEESGRAVHAKF